MISNTIRKPGSYSEFVKGTSGALPPRRFELLIIAQRLAAGVVAANIPTRIYSPEQAAVQFGAGSVMHRMAMAVLRQFPSCMLSGCGVDDNAAGVAATSTITFGGAGASETGTSTLYLGTDRLTIRLDTGTTAAQAAAKLAAEITLYPHLPVTAAAVEAVVTLTAKNKGTCGNLLGQHNAATGKTKPVVISETAGITAVATDFTGGATDPSLTTAFTAVAGYRYHLIALPFQTSDAATALSEHLTSVSNEVNQRGARGYMFLSGALADATTLAAINDKRICIGYVRGCRRPSFENAAAFAAIQASVESPWLAINDAELVGCDAPDVPSRFTGLEIDTLLWNGVTPFEVGAGERVRCVRAISTYVKNDADSPDDAWLDSFKIATADYVRDAIRMRHRNDFANAILRDSHVDGEPAGVVTPADVRSTNLDVCRRIEREGGLNTVSDYVDLFVSTRDPNVPGRVNSEIPIDIVDAAHILANTISIVSSL